MLETLPQHIGVLWDNGRGLTGYVSHSAVDERAHISSPWNSKFHGNDLLKSSHIIVPVSVWCNQALYTMYNMKHC